MNKKTPQAKAQAGRSEKSGNYFQETFGKKTPKKPGRTSTERSAHSGTYAPEERKGRKPYTAFDEQRHPGSRNKWKGNSHNDQGQSIRGAAPEKSGYRKNRTTDVGATEKSFDRPYNAHRYKAKSSADSRPYTAKSTDDADRKKGRGYDQEQQDRTGFSPKKSGYRKNRTTDEGGTEKSFDRPYNAHRYKAKSSADSRPYTAKNAEHVDKNKDEQRKLRRYADSENPHEKAYSATGFAGRKGRSFNPNHARNLVPERPAEEQMPLNKFIAHCGICSRRDAVALIKDGKVRVNGEVQQEPGFKISDQDQVSLNGKRIDIQKNLVYILLNKPKGYITTTDDPKGRRTVMDILSGYIDERVFPVGRLDRNTTGLLLLTNDGALAQKLSHPKYHMRKVYQVTLDRALEAGDYALIKQGVVLEDGKADVDALEYLGEAHKLGLEIHSGKNRIVRRIFESLGYTVEKLDRVMYAGLTKKNIIRGKWRMLSAQEVINLKHLH